MTRSGFAFAYFGMSSCIFFTEVSASSRMASNINGTHVVHHSVCSLGNLSRRDRVPVEGRPLPRPLGDFRWIQPDVLVGVIKVHVGVGRLAREEDL